MREPCKAASLTSANGGWHGVGGGQAVFPGGGRGGGGGG